MKETSIDRVGDRCRRICGEARDDCFINSRKKINCIADMVVNKTAVMSISLGALMKSNDPEIMKKKAEGAMRNAAELSNWIKYLQMVPDLQALSSLVLDAVSEEKRMEIRYPLPAEDEGKIRVVLPGGQEAVLADFSQSGLGMVSAEQLGNGSEQHCRLTSDATGPHMDVFSAKVMYSVPSGGGYVTGMRIGGVMGQGAFNFFNMVNQLLLDIEMQGL